MYPVLQPDNSTISRDERGRAGDSFASEERRCTRRTDQTRVSSNHQGIDLTSCEPDLRLPALA